MRQSMGYLVGKELKKTAFYKDMSYAANDYDGVMVFPDKAAARRFVRELGDDCREYTFQEIEIRGSLKNKIMDSLFAGACAVNVIAIGYCLMKGAWM